METVEMITHVPWRSGLVLPESGSVKLVPDKLGCSGVMLPESESDDEKMTSESDSESDDEKEISEHVDMLMNNLWSSDPLRMESKDIVMPDEMSFVRRVVPPDSESSLILPERGMDTYDEGSKEERNRWGSEHPEKERSIRSMLKNLELDEAEKMKLKNPMPDESLVADAVAKAAEGGKRRKKVMVTVSQEHIDYMIKHPLPPPYKPSYTISCSSFREAVDMFVANQEAAYKEQQRIFEDYRHFGHAEYEVTVDEEVKV